VNIEFDDAFSPQKIGFYLFTYAWRVFRQVAMTILLAKYVDVVGPDWVNHLVDFAILIGCIEVDRRVASFPSEEINDG
jgi:hypothetical protein